MNYQLIQTIIGGMGLITIFLLWWQIKSELKWKKITFSIDKIDLQLLEEKGIIIKNSGIDISQNDMSDDEFNKIKNKENVDAVYAIWEVLNMLERFATLYNMKVLNKYFSYESYSEDMIRYYKKFKRIIDYYCSEYDPLYYDNLKKCAKEFIEINKKESTKIKKYNQRVNKLQDSIGNMASAIKNKF